MSLQQQKPNPGEVENFFERLERFRGTLNEPEKTQLDALVVVGAGEEPPTPEGEGGTNGADLSDEESNAFFKKLEGFKDELPDPEEILLKDLLNRAAEPVDVKGHDWTDWVPHAQVSQAYQRCRRSGHGFGIASVVNRNAHMSKVYCNTWW